MVIRGKILLRTESMFENNHLYIIPWVLYFIFIDIINVFKCIQDEL